MHRTWATGLAAALSLTGASVSAQSVSTPRFGVTAELNLARVSGNEVQDVSNRLGFGGGAYLAIPMGPQFDFQPEILFATKGTKSGSGSAEATLALSYVEIPLLARVNFKSSSSVTPFLAFGPALAIKASCSVDLPPGAGSSNDCAQITDGEFNTLDAGLVMGAGLSFAVAGRSVLLGIRYDLGLRRIVTDSDSKNRVLSFVGGFEVPFGGK
jgi:outer membrane protein with beta-barrel domain